MARARLLRPEFFLHEGLGALSPLHRLLFAGLWTLADREGRLEDRPMRIKIQVLPWDQCDIDSMLNSLDESGSIVRYQVDGRKLIEIPSFNEYQKPHPKEPAATIPAPCVVKKPRRAKQDKTLLKPRIIPDREVSSETLTETESKTDTDQLPLLAATTTAPAASPSEPSEARKILAELARQTGQPDIWESGDYAVVNKALKTGFTPDQMFLAISGIKNDPWPERRINLGPGKIFGRADSIKKYIELAENGAPKPKVDVRRGHVRAEDMDWSGVPLGKVQIP